MLTSLFLFLNLLNNPNAQLLNLFVSSTIFFLVGGVIYILPVLSVPRLYEDITLTLVMVLSILQLAFRMEGRLYASNYLWFIPILYLIIATIFDSRFLSLAILISGILFNGYLWYNFNNSSINVGDQEYISRISLLILTFLFTNYFKYLFVKRKNDLLKANSELKLAKEILSQASEAVCITDLNSRIISVNKAYCKCQCTVKRNCWAQHQAF